MKLNILGAAVAAAFLLGSAPAVAQAQETTAPALTESGHKPGNVGHGVNLPADTTYTTVDGERVTHPCAGRKLVYQSHNDALYDTRYGGRILAVMAVDGQ
ncbi:hypothetical protein [Corynebacterium lipophiloflavum]|uniref:Secreted protein n=1 Tax=Corynebacterium lipophiloflavum (strain ATCC 700352 / DSM 44291 / CCUG 37336 / JCM 10383 / DMMZ 1944) TaxID=525263 RepID=C0XUJ6_CORLD|nr:hypothetical protein [Corynebacterium lipophiloflavum]EEI16021.1 hypothetical protein HMPREF0298_2116 [Corynebacterium lipophiloflavum DSM 44291]